MIFSNVNRFFIRLLFLLFGLSSSSVVAQIPIYAWRDHLSWNTAEIVVIAGKKVYCSNGAGICIYDMQSRTLEKLTKVNGLNDAGITAMQYSADTGAVVVGYENGNVDIVAGNKVYNIPDIKRDKKYSRKRINHIYTLGNFAYLSCSFGIVAVDLQKRYIRDDCIIGESGAVDVFSLTVFNGYFYAATAEGLKKADTRNSLLNDFSYWEKVDGNPAGNRLLHAVSTDRSLYICDSDNRIFAYNGQTWNLLPTPYTSEKIRSLTVSGNSLLASASNAIFIIGTNSDLTHTTIQSYSNDMPIAAYCAALDNDGACWIADNRQGLIKWNSAGDISFYASHLNGPASNHAATLRFKADRLLVASGGKGENGMPLNRQGEIHAFFANQWTTITPDGAYDFTDVDISENQPSTYFVSSWGNGVYVFENDVLKVQYSQSGSSLSADFSGNVLCGGLMMDADNKLWVSNDRNVSLFSSERWEQLSFETSASFGRFTEDNFGQIWTTHGDDGLFVFSKTAPEANISFKPYNYTHTVPIDISNCIAGAPDGVVWVATTKGPVYYDKPSVILNGEGTGGFHANRPGTSEPGNMYPLLGSENILSVAIDGAYRKWFGTETYGVFLIDEDNTGVAKHFTVDNSPLFSNKIHDIAINDKTGEVFFATEYGIISYRSDAVSSGDNFGRVYAYPSPVRPDYDGEITITGLIRDADVKITDIAGNLVYQTRTLGGQAVWNGRNRQGRRVATGVYLVFCSNDDGSKTHVTKILFIR